MEPLTSWRTSALRRAPSPSGANERPLHARPADGHVRARPRAGLPIAAAAATFAAAFAIGMATKSSSSRQPATSLAPPVAIQVPSASVPTLQPGVPTPALKPRPAPPHPPKTAPVAPPVAPASTAPVAPRPTTGVAQPPGGVIHRPSGVVHTTSGGSSSNGGAGVVHGGN